jgi:hypothetical protein
LRALEPVHLEVVTDASQVGLWNEYVERFHPLGYKGESAPKTPFRQPSPTGEL